MCDVEDEFQYMLCGCAVSFLGFVHLSGSVIFILCFCVVGNCCNGVCMQGILSFEE